ncbi:hypothetical protein HOY82DRAFT_535826 [Tuber indicum]|nr:hypothetical protein HOY82DRAFT_535826 [Tuber indicum]
MQAKARKGRQSSGKRPILTTPTLTTSLIAAAIKAAENVDSIPILSNPVTESTAATLSKPAKVSDPVFEIIINSGRLMELVQQLADMQTGLGEHLNSIGEGKLAGEAHYLDTAVWALEMLIASRKGGNGGEGDN